MDPPAQLRETAHHKIVGLLATRLAEIQRMDCTQPGECNHGMMLHFANTNFPAELGVPAFARWLQEVLPEGQYRTHKRMLQHSQGKGPTGMMDAEIAAAPDGSSGFVEAYAGPGANVVLSVRSHDRIAAEIKAADGGRAIAADAGEKADLERLVDGARAAFGPIHILFNNAAAGVVYAADGGLWVNTDEVWKTAMDVNVMATWRLTELTEADMKANGKGNIISVQSCGGFKPIPPAVAYGVSKVALLFLVR